MTSQDSPVNAQGDTLLRLVGELTDITEKLITCTVNDQFDAADALTRKRARCIGTLEEIHRTVSPVPVPTAEISPELRTALALLRDTSKALNDTIVEKSASIMSTLQALQSNRFYGNTPIQERE